MRLDWERTGRRMGFIDLTKYEAWAYDTECTGLKYKVDKVFGFSVATPDGQSGYFDIREQPDAVQWLVEQADSYKGTIVCHNASFDYRMSLHSGIKLPLSQIDDTGIRACCINEHESTIFPWTRGKAGDYSLDYLAKKYVGAQKYAEIYDELAAMFGGKATRKTQMPNLYRAPSGLVRKYACPDAELTLELWLEQQELIAKRGLEKIVAFERKVMPTLIRAEARGVRVDLNYAEQAILKMDGVVRENQAKMFQLAGREFNPNSPKQVREVFGAKEERGVWTSRDGTVLERTATGNPCLDADALRAMKDPLAAAVLELRSNIKTKDTFLAKHVVEHSVGGRVYPNINQMKGEDGGTGTGRLSYTGPALQQIPSRNKRIAAIIKPAFLPEEGQLWLDSDMASFEVRIFAHLVAAYNPAIARAYAENPELDLHQWVGDLMGIPRNASYSGQANAKQMNLGMIFNRGDGAVADSLGMPWEWCEFTDKKGDLIRYKKAGPEAKAVIAAYHTQIQGVKTLATRAQKIAEERGWIQTAHGRRLRFPNGYKSYKASGILIQATAADENKENWLRIEDALGSDGSMILNTHDSYSMSVDENWKPIWERVKKAVERQTLRVPLLLEFDGVGKNWAEAKGLIDVH
ncbi:DNA polymerase I [Vibrio phage VP5]|uniref:DNA polymerase I n=1 Tax=Vibrio phage VP5 TaxID=260827 RepID=Q6R6A6_9CAUD|nr:DNA polymerase I [Vibrio phage VP5]AAR92073.1 DNA polymerase I [Vibrio phage VP5]